MSSSSPSMAFQRRIGSVTWSRESCKRVLLLCARATSTEAWERSSRGGKGKTVKKHSRRRRLLSLFCESMTPPFCPFFFFLLSQRFPPFLLRSFSPLPSTASCSAPSAPHCAARVLAQLRVPPLRPDAASRPVSFLREAFGSVVEGGRLRRAIAMLVFHSFFVLFVQVAESAGRPCSGFALDLLLARGRKEKRTKQGMREKPSDDCFSQRRLFSDPKKQKKLHPFSPPPPPKKNSKKLPQTPTARPRSLTLGSPRRSPPSGRRSTPSSSSWEGGRSRSPRR